MSVSSTRPLYPRQKRRPSLKPEVYDSKPAPSTKIVEKDGKYTIALGDSGEDRNSYAPKLHPGLERKRSSLVEQTDEEQMANFRKMFFGAGQQEEEEEEPKPENKLEKLNDLGLDGFSSLAEASSTSARVFWVILIGSVLAVLSYQIYKTIDSYVHNAVVTTYSVQQNESMKFPIIYICPGNFLNETHFKLHIRETQTALAFQTSLVNQSATPANNKNTDRPKREAFRPDEMDGIDSEYMQQLLELNPYRLEKPEQQQFDYSDEEEWPEELDPDMELMRIRRDVLNQNQTVQFAGNRTGNGTTGNSTTPAPLPLLNMTADEVYNFMLEVGFDSKQVFLECKYYDETQEVHIPCEDIVTDMVDVNYGKCYKVDMGDRVQKTEALGLSLIIDTFNSRVSKDPRLYKRYNGMFIAAHESLNPASWEKVFVGGGTYLNMDVSLEHYELIDVERDDFNQPCVGDDEALLEVINASYSQTACQLDCFMKKIVDVCHCVLMMDRSYIRTEITDNNPFCSKDAGVGCIVPKVTNNLDRVEEVQQCRYKCHVPCESWRYKVLPTRMGLNPRAFDNLPENISYSDILQLDVSFSRLQYVEFSQSLQTSVDTFIGNLGGQITGWVGGSMLILINIPVMISKFLVLRSVKKAKNTLFTRQETTVRAVTGFQSIIQAKRTNIP